MSDFDPWESEREKLQRAVEEFKIAYESTSFYRFLLKTVDILSRWLTRR